MRLIGSKEDQIKPYQEPGLTTIFKIVRITKVSLFGLLSLLHSHSISPNVDGEFLVT